MWSSGQARECKAATYAEAMLPPNERDLMDLCDFELYPVDRPEPLRTLDDLTRKRLA